MASSSPATFGSLLSIRYHSSGAWAPPPVPIFDSHVHLNDERMQLSLMDEYGIGRAVIFWGRLSDNEAIAQAAARHPGRFVPFASISPERGAYRTQWERDDPAIVAHLVQERMSSLLPNRRSVRQKPARHKKRRAVVTRQGRVRPPCDTVLSP